MSNIFSNMGLTSSKLFQISFSFSDIIKKSDVIQLVAVVKSLLKIAANLKSQTIKNIKNTVATMRKDNSQLVTPILSGDPDH